MFTTCCRVACIAALTLSIATVASGQATPSPSSTPACNYAYVPAGSNTAAASWDLTKLFDSTKDYVWEDNDDAFTTNSQYTFQICGNVNTPPQECGPVVAQNGQGPAFQVTRNGNTTCYNLGKDQNSKTKPRYFQLIDRRNPARGIALTYTGGSIVDNCPVPRQLTIEFICEPRMTFPAPGPTPPPRLPHSFTWMDEMNTCQYVAHSYSPFGCPLECPRVNGAVCGGNGICGWDTSLVMSRCFCDDDYMEADCMTPRSPAPAGTIAGSVFGGILLGSLGLVASIYFLQRRNAPKAAAAVEGFY